MATYTSSCATLALDANDFFSNSSGLPTAIYRRNQFGAAVGGPIKKDRTFFFFDYEGIRQTQDQPTTNSVPSAAARAGNLVSGPINREPGCRRSIWGSIPLPNGLVNGDTGLFTFQDPQIVKENYYTTRVDHKISDKDGLFATYTFDKTPFTQDDSFGNESILTSTGRTIAALEESHIFSPALVNTARLGFNRNYVVNSESIAAINPLSDDPSLGAFPGGFNPQTKVHGIGSLAAGVGGGYSLFGWNSIQFHDDAFWTHGTHALKFGYSMEREQYNFFQDYNPYGIWTFNSLKNFLLDQPNQLEGGLPGSLSPRGLRQTIFAGYIQDDWKIRRNLTLNIGLRYEMATVINEVQGKLTNLSSFSAALPYCGTTQPTPVNTVFGVPGCTPGAQSYYQNPSKLNFEPRLGFAWDPRGNGKTAVRGGFAIFDVLLLPGYYYTQESIETPFFLDGIVATTKSKPLAGIGVLSEPARECVQPNRNKFAQRLLYAT